MACVILQVTAASMYGDVLSEDGNSNYGNSKATPSFTAWRT